MKLLHIRVLLLLFQAPLFLCHLYAQPSGDSILLTAAVWQATRLYQTSLFPENSLYNGSEYIPYKQKLQGGHPFFQANSPLQGEVTYNNQLFEDVSLMFDLLKDELIIIHPGNKFRINLIKARIDSFTINNHRFIHIRNNNHDQLKIAPGFYESMYSGKTRLLRKISKTVDEHLETATGAYYTVSEKTVYFLEKENTYYPVRNKKALYKVLKEKKKELKAYDRTHHRGDHAKEEVFKNLAAYYDELTN